MNFWDRLIVLDEFQLRYFQMETVTTLAKLSINSNNIFFNSTKDLPHYTSVLQHDQKWYFLRFITAKGCFEGFEEIHLPLVRLLRCRRRHVNNRSC